MGINMLLCNVMRVLCLSLVAALSLPLLASAQADTFSANLSLGSKGPQVLALQKLLNREPDTRIAVSGPGSPGNETGHFGVLTKAAVIRFQNKYGSEILTPAGLSSGNGFVGARTRAKLNALSALAASTKSQSPPTATSTSIKATSTPAAAATSTSFRVQPTEKIDVYAGDKKFTDYQSQITDAINATIASRGATSIAIPTTTQATFPSVVIGPSSPRAGAPGTKVSLFGFGLAASSVVYFGNEYVVRGVSGNSQGGISFAVPPLPPGPYDIAVRTGNAVSNTTPFVILDSQSQPVVIDSISPTTVKYGETVTLTGSGFTRENNTVTMTYQKITGVPSNDGRTLSVVVAPEMFREYAKVGNGSATLPMIISVMNANGFSTANKSFTLAI